MSGVFSGIPIDLPRPNQRFRRCEGLGIYCSELPTTRSTEPGLCPVQLQCGLIHTNDLPVDGQLNVGERQLVDGKILVIGVPVARIPHLGIPSVCIGCHPKGGVAHVQRGEFVVAADELKGVARDGEFVRFEEGVGGRMRSQQPCVVQNERNVGEMRQEVHVDVIDVGIGQEVSLQSFN